MHRDKSKLIAVALVVALMVAFVAAIGLGAPAFAKSTHGGKGKIAASQTTHSVNVRRERALNAYGSVRRSTFGAPNSNSPALTGGGSPGYNANLYVY